MRFSLKTFLVFFFKLLNFFIKKQKPPDAPRRILLLMCNWLGDTFWAMQVIPAIKKKYPEAEIFACCKSGSVHLLNGLIKPSNIIILQNVISDRQREQFHFNSFLNELKTVSQQNFDLLIDLTCNPFSAIFTLFSKAKLKRGGICNDFEFVYDAFTSNDQFKNQHLSKRPFIINDIEYPGKLFPPQISKKLAVNSDNYAVIMPGAGWGSKIIPDEVLIDLGNYIADKNLDIFICCAESEKDKFISLQDKISNSKFFCGSFSEAIALTKECRFYIGGDTGLTHIAASWGTNTLSLYCSTNPQYAAPLGDSVKLFQPSCPMQASNDSEQCANTLFKPRCPRSEWMNFNLAEIKIAIDEFLHTEV